MSTNHDVIVVGSGTAGQTAAYELNGNGLRVALVEASDRPGGVCALSGCQAKKWFYEGTETVSRSRHLQGIGISTPAKANWRDLRSAKNEFTDNIPDNTENGLYEAGITFIEGTARFRDAHTLAVDGQTVSAPHIILATGAEPMALHFAGAEHAITSSDFLELEHLPDRIVFVGGGFISFEFAHFAARLGADGTRCTILEAAERPLGAFDDEMVDLLVSATEAEGIAVHSGVEITRIDRDADGFHVRTSQGRSFDADLVVHGAGRSPSLAALDLERAGIDHGRRGIRVNPFMQTSQPHIYAIGDCAATLQLARVADAEALTAASHLVSQTNNGPLPAQMNYTAVPAVLFTYPQYGRVGATEDQLKEAGVPYTRRFAKNLTWPTYRRVGLKTAAYKVLAGEDGQLLGAHLLSDDSTGLLAVFAMAMANRIPVRALYRQSLLTPYPSRISDMRYMLDGLG